jgi:hypothetical protein
MHYLLLNLYSNLIKSKIAELRRPPDSHKHAVVNFFC